MAQVTRVRTVVNRGRKNRGSVRKNHARNRSRVNHRRRNKRGSNHRRRNSGEIIGYTLANTGRRKRRNMASTKRNRGRRRNAGVRHNRRHHRRHNRRNAGTVVTRINRRHHHRRRNGYRRNQGRVVDLGMTALFTVVGAVGSKLGAQALLGANNTGLMGYAANAAVGGVLWFVAEKFAHNKAIANGMIAGTAVQIVIRLINDYTPFGQYVSNLGVGDYMAQAFVTPQVLTDPYNNASISIPAGWGGAPAIAAAGVAGLGAGSVYEGAGNLY